MNVRRPQPGASQNSRRTDSLLTGHNTFLSTTLRLDRPIHLRLVSLDVGYALDEPSGTTLTQRLAELSPRPAQEAKRVAQRILHALDPSLGDAGPQTVCAAMGIAPSAFPHDRRPPAFTL